MEPVPQPAYADAPAASLGHGDAFCEPSTASTIPPSTAMALAVQASPLGAATTTREGGGGRCFRRLWRRGAQT
jgi:hypothetical protein